MNARPSPHRWGIEIAPERYARFAEFFVSAVNWARAHVDDEGRPLGERVLPAEVRPDVPFRMVECPFAGTRSGRPMNVSAMTSVSRGWGRILADLAALRVGFVRAAPAEPTWLTLWLFGRVATALAAAYLRRTGSDTVPVRLSTAFKPALGLFMTSERTTLFTGIDPWRIVHPAAFVRAAEATRALVSHDAACPGPVRMIEEMADVALGRSTISGADWPAALVAPLDAVVSYGLASARLELARQSYICQLLLLTRELAARTGAAPPPISIKGRVPPTEVALRVEQVHRRAAALVGETLPAPVALPAAARGPARGAAELRELADRFEADWLSVFRRIQAQLDAIHPASAPAGTIESDDLAHMTGFACHMVEWQVRAVSRLSPHDLLVPS
jgi:hypothetical protein